MSISVKIKGRGILTKRVPKLEDLILEGWSFGIMDEWARIIPNQKGDFIILFNADEMARGISLEISRQSVTFGQSVPTSEKEIRDFYEYVRHTCEVMGTYSFEKDGKKAVVSDIPILIETDIKKSEDALISMEEDLIKSRRSCQHIYCVSNPIALGEEDFKIIGGKLDDFGKMIDRRQGIDAYYAAPAIYKKGGMTVGEYRLERGTRVLFPKKPAIISVDKDLKQVKIDKWLVRIENDGGSERDTMTESFDKFAEGINKSERYDAEHFIVTI